jgi:membrane-bound lytic murein transglycosylase MltF
VKPDSRYDSLVIYYIEHESTRQQPDSAAWPLNLWLLVKAQIRQESGFDPRVRNTSSGALGLMQLMPNTALEVGVRDRTNPEESIRGGVEHLVRTCWRIFRRETGLERWRYALASYNAGQRNIIRAQELAEGRGLDPSRWVSIVQVLPRITGEANAAQTTDYVARIMAEYEAVA